MPKTAVYSFFSRSSSSASNSSSSSRWLMALSLASPAGSSRGLFRARPGPERALDREEPVEELPRLEVGLELDCAVQEPRLVLDADGPRVPEGGDAPDLRARQAPQRLDGPGEIALAITEVR